MRLDQGPDLRFLLGLGIGGNRQVVERQLVPFGQVPHHFMVGHHPDDIDGQGAVFPVVEQAVQAVAPLGHRNQHLGLAVHIVNRPVHAVLLAHRPEQLADRGQLIALGALEHGAHKEAPLGHILKLGGLADIEAALGEQTGHRRHKALGILTTEGKYYFPHTGHGTIPDIE